MYNKACLGIPKSPEITTLQSLMIITLDLINFLNVAGDKLEIQGSI